MFKFCGYFFYKLTFSVICNRILYVNNEFIIIILGENFQACSIFFLILGVWDSKFLSGRSLFISDKPFIYRFKTSLEVKYQPLHKNGIAKNLKTFQI